VRLTKAARVVGEQRTLEADELTVQMTPDDRLIQTMALRGNSRITGSGGGGPDRMAARDIDLTYGPDGRTLRHARLMENATADLPAAPGAPPRTIAGRAIDVALAEDGATVSALTATDAVQVDIPAAEGAPARRINAAALTAGGAAGLETATFTGGVTFREMRPASKGAAAGERIARSLRLAIRTQPGLGAIQQAEFRGNVRIEDGSTSAEGQRALYRVAQDGFDISPSPGDPGPPSSMNDGRVLVHARTISFSISTRNLTADTDVRSSLQSTPRKGGAGPGGDPKLPSMLKQDEPVNVTSNRLAYDGAAGVATYTGDARLFQGQTSILADTIVLEDKTSNLTAKCRVRTVMFLEDRNAKTQATELVETKATGDTMVYEDLKRLATYTTGPTAKAHIVGAQGDLTADVIQLFLRKDVNELERAEADGHVVVKEGGRTGTGNHLTYTAANETYVLDGTPVEIEERTPTSCRVTVASSVRFQRSTSSTFVTNNGVTPSIVKPCAAKPPA
jgi:lipopolysaccharide export system protein LptA